MCKYCKKEHVTIISNRNYNSNINSVIEIVIVIVE